MQTGLGRLFPACVVALVACGGGETSDLSDPPGCTTSVDGGWVEIQVPTTACTYAAAGTTLALSGTAFVSPTWWHCCPADAGVTVTWRNSATSESGTATSTVTGGITWTHEWSAMVPISSGSNAITITAADPSGKTGTKTLTVAVTP